MKMDQNKTEIVADSKCKGGRVGVGFWGVQTVSNASYIVIILFSFIKLILLIWGS